MTPRHLVTGGSGYIGTCLAQLLRERGVEVWTIPTAAVLIPVRAILQ